MLPDAILLDFDGTLVNSEPVHTASIERAFAAFGVVLSEPERAFIVGHGWHEIYVELGISRRLGLTLAEIQARAVAAKDEMFREGLRLSPEPGVGELLGLAQGLGIATALVTGSCRAEVEQIWPALGLPFSFGTVVTADDVRAGKPDPEGYLQACRALGVSPRRAMAIEDSEAGIASALAAGARVLATASCNPAPGRPGHQDQTPAHRVVSDLQGLSRLDLEALMR